MHLFSPLTFGHTRLPNRIAMTAMPSGYAAADGFANAALTAYYAERAQGGTGLIVIEPAWAVAPTTSTPHLGLYADAYVPDLRACVGAVQQAGAAVLVMIDQPLAVLDLSVGDLRDLSEAWVAAAWRAWAAGATGIMFSCADGGPLEQLVSPLHNTRTDVYGGDTNRRIRLLLDTVEQITTRMGARLVIGVRLNVEEFTPGGLTLQDARVIAKRLVGAGVDLIEVSAEAQGSVPVAQFPGWRVPLAEGIKAVIDVPVMVGGLLADAELADSVIRDGSADLVALSESLRIEPRWPQYARTLLAEHDERPYASDVETGLL